MVFSQVQQPNTTYLLWRRFRFPTPDGSSIDAVAVPAHVHAELNSAYTFMAAWIVVNVWAVVIGCGMYFYLRNNNKGNVPNKENHVTDISISVWNKRASPQESLLDTVLYARDDVKRWWFWPLIVAIIAASAAKVVAGVLIPRNLFVGNGAPVDPTSIYVPSLDFPEDDRMHLSAAYALDVPATLRAAGGALVANDTLQSAVHIGTPVILGQHSATEPIQRIEYGYEVSGADMGLQHFPDLLLTVTGACTTDYTWYNANISARANNGADYYFPWGNVSDENQQYVSVDDGTAPTAIYVLGDVSPTGPAGNITWGAIVSSVFRGSFRVGTDPWYLTSPTANYTASDPKMLPNTVLPRRPALSCWQQDVWHYRGATSDVAHLGEPALPGLTLSSGLQTILTRYLGSPKVVSVAQRLNPSSLQSATTALGLGFDAGASSAHADLRRLVLAAYIATVNTLTDTTLYSPRASSGQGEIAIPNIALDIAGAPLAGVGEFVVYSTDVVTLSVRSLIVIPVVTVGCWVLMMVLLHLTPMKKVNSMEVINLFRDVKREFENANIHIDKETGESRWFFRHKPHAEIPLIKETVRVGESKA